MNSNNMNDVNVLQNYYMNGRKCVIDGNTRHGGAALTHLIYTKMGGDLSCIEDALPQAVRKIHYIDGVPKEEIPYLCNINKDKVDEYLKLREMCRLVMCKVVDK